MLKELIKLADHLDSIGEADGANTIDALLGHIQESEGHESEEHSGNSYMIPSQLNSIFRKAADLLSAYEAGYKFDDWMESYISQADLMIDNIHDKIVGEYSGEKSCGCSEECDCDKKSS
jgi:hypothetical protein